MLGRLHSTRMRAALAVIKLVIVPIAIGWVILDLLRRSPTNSLTIQPWWLLAAIAAIQVALWLVSLRLVQLLAIHHAPLRSRTALLINLRSMFYFLVVPTQAGMEAVRFFGLRAGAPDASNTAIAGTLVLDRVVGAVAAAILFMLSAVYIGWGRLQIAPLRFDAQFFAVALVALALLGIVAIACKIAIGRSIRIAGFISLLFSSRWQLSIILFYAVLAQAFVVASVACALQGLNFDVPVVALTFGIMGGNFLMIIPISFAGLGPAELAGAALLLFAGIAEPTAIMAVFVTYLTRVYAGLQGAMIELWDEAMNLSMIARISNARTRSVGKPL